MKKLFIIGLMQAVGIIGYCVLVSLIFNFLGTRNIEPPKIIGFASMLVILVFSAATCSLIVFGYPAYLFFKEGKIKEPLKILFFTGVFCLIIAAILALIYLIF